MNKVSKICQNNHISYSGGVFFFKKKKLVNLLEGENTLAKKQIKVFSEGKLLNSSVSSKNKLSGNKESNQFYGSRSNSFKKKNNMQKKKVVMPKRQSIILNLTRSRVLKNKKQLSKYFKKKNLIIFEKKLELDPLPKSKTIDVVGEVVTKYNRRRLLYTIRKNTRLYSKKYPYKLLISRLLLGHESAAFLSDFDSFNSKNGGKGFRLFRWYSLLSSDKRFSSDFGSKIFLFRKNAIDSLFSKNYFKFSREEDENASTFSKKSSKFLTYARVYGSKNTGVLLKRADTENRNSSYIKKLKHALRWKSRTSVRIINKRLAIRRYPVKHYIKADNRGLYSLPKMVAAKVTDQQTRGRRLKVMFFRANRKRIKISRIKNFYLSKIFLAKSATFKSNYCLNSYRGLGFLRKNKYSRISMLSTNIVNAYTGLNLFSKKKLSKSRIKKNKYKIFIRNNSRFGRERARFLVYLWKTRKKTKRYRFKKNNFSYFKNYRLFFKTGLYSRYLNKKIYNILELENKKNIFYKEFSRFYYNSGTRYGSNNFSWDFFNNSLSTEYALTKPYIRSVSKFFYRSRYKAKFLFPTYFYKRLAFKKKKFYKKSGFFPVKVRLVSSVKANIKTGNIFSKKFINTESLDNSNYLNTLLKFSKVSSNTNFGSFFIKNFFNKLKLSTSRDLFTPSRSSSKFSVNNNYVNFFNLDFINLLVTKNMKIFNNIDYSKIFKKLENSESKKLRKYEKKNAVKRRLNVSYYSMFFFFNQRETYLYRKYLLTYKKHLRKIGKVGGNIILKKRIRFYNSWRAQYMSSNFSTVYTLDSKKVKYNFTNHLAVNRKNVNYLKKNLYELRKSMRKNIKVLIRKKIKWYGLPKVKGSAKLLDRDSANCRKNFGKVKRSVWSKIKRNFKFKTMSMYPSSYVGKRLIRRLRRRLFKRKKLFWTHKRFLFGKNFKNFGYFWAKLSEGYSKYNLEFRRKAFKFNWTRVKPRTYFKKVRPFLFKVKNPFYWRKHGQFAKRFYPKFWYKVFRRKFPLKRHRKDWALKISKMFALWQHKKKKQTFYDSSAVYFKNLSINVKPKRHRNYLSYKRKFAMQYIDRDLEIFDFEKDPKFDRKNNQVHKFKGPVFIHWKGRVMYRDFKKKMSLVNSWIFNPTKVSREFASIKKNNIDHLDFKIYSIYTKGRASVLRDRFSSYSTFMSILKRKILTHYDSRSYHFTSKQQLETKAIFDSINDNNITYFQNSFNKYSIIKKNSVYTRSVLTSSLLDSFGEESSDIFNKLNFKYDFADPDRKIITYVLSTGQKNYWENLLYTYTSKYRFPVFENTHSVCRGDIKNELLSLVTADSKKFNKNHNSTKGLSRIYFRNLDFLKQLRIGGSYKFINKVSKFYKKNMWMFSMFEFSSQTYLTGYDV